MLQVGRSQGLLLCVVLCAAACSSRSPGNGDGGKPSDVADENGTQQYNDLTVETFVTPNVIEAGEAASVRCVVSHEHDHVPSVATTVAIDPHPGDLSPEDDGTMRFSPIRAGAYHVRCRTADERFTDEVGVDVRVLPSAIASADTALERSIAPAGEPVEALCRAFDRFENPVVDAAATGLTTGSDTLVTEQVGAGRHTVYGTLVGDYEVGCRFGDVGDLSPESFTVTAGPAASAAVTTDATSVRPKEVVHASCTVTDAYGNTLPDIETGIQVVNDAGLPATESGLLLEENGFSAERAGIYYVFCVVAGQRAGSENPVVVTVDPDLPHSWTVTLEELDCYWQRYPLPLTYGVYDIWGNEIPNAVVSVESDPPGGVQSDGAGGLVVRDEGDYVLTLTVAEPHDPEGSLEPFTAFVRVDSTPPSVSIKSPARGEAVEVGTRADSPVTIRGEVHDELSALAELLVNDVRVPVSGTERSTVFDVVSNSRWGLNIITARAEDACGNGSVEVQSYLRSPTYFAPEVLVHDDARVGRALVAHLTQDVVDDSDRSDADDLATLAEVIVGAMNWNRILAPDSVLVDREVTRECNGFWLGPEYSFQLIRRGSDALTIGGPFIDGLRIVDGGLAFSLSVGDIAVPLDVMNLRSHGCEFWIPSVISLGDHHFWVRATGAQADGVLRVYLSDQRAVVDVGAIDMEVSGLDLDFVCPPWIDWACDAVGDLVIYFARGALLGALEEAIRSQLPPIIGGLLNSFSVMTDLQLPEPLSMGLNVESGLDSVTLTEQDGGYAELGLHVQVFPTERGSGVPADVGVIRKDGHLPPFAPLPRGEHEIGIGLKDDLVNQVLWALWYGGGLDFPDLTPFIQERFGTDFDGIALSLSAQVPPVVMPGRDGHQIEVGLGDLYVDATVDVGTALNNPDITAPPISVRLYLSAIIGGELSFDNAENALTVALDDDPIIHAAVTEIDDPGYQTQVSDLLSRLMRLMIPELLGPVLGSFPIPQFNIGDLAQLDEDVILEIQGGILERPATGDYYRITGSLQ